MGNLTYTFQSSTIHCPSLTKRCFISTYIYAIEKKRIVQKIQYSIHFQYFVLTLLQMENEEMHHSHISELLKSKRFYILVCVMIVIVVSCIAILWSLSKSKEKNNHSEYDDWLKKYLSWGIYFDFKRIIFSRSHLWVNRLMLLV